VSINPLDIYKKIRKIWKINPKTKIKNRKRKSRHQEKIDLKKEI
jgi:hypothetical protein